MFESDRETARAEGRHDAKSGRDWAPPGPRPGQGNRELRSARKAYDSGYFFQAGFQEGREGRLIGKTETYKLLESHASNAHRAKAYEQGYEAGQRRERASPKAATSSRGDSPSSSRHTGGGSASSGYAFSAVLLYVSYILPTVTLLTTGVIVGGSGRIDLVGLTLVLLPVVNWVGLIGALAFSEVNSDGVVTAAFAFWIFAPMLAAMLAWFRRGDA